MRIDRRIAAAAGAPWAVRAAHLALPWHAADYSLSTKTRAHEGRPEERADTRGNPKALPRRKKEATFRAGSFVRRG